MSGFKDVLNISELAKRFSIDRTTVRTRLEGIEPYRMRNNEKLYKLVDVEELLAADEDIEAIKKDKLKAEKNLKELQLERERGDFASVAEFTEIVQKMFGTLHKRVVMQMPSKLGGKLQKSKTPALATQLLKRELGKEFDNLRTNFTEYL